MKPIKETLEQTYSQGMENLYIGETEIVDIDGLEGKLSYRGYNIKELAEHSSYDEVSYLIIHGDLPTPFQYEKWVSQIRSWEEPPLESIMVLRSLPMDAHTFMLYRTMLTVAACHMPEGENTRIEAQWRRPARIFAWSSSLAAAAICHTLGHQLGPVNQGGSYSANFLSRSLKRELTELESRAFDVCMILQAEHGCQASTLAALTVISTGADLGSAVIAGTGALSGQLHGGAIQQSYINLLNLNTVDEAKKWVKDKIEENYKFPGFGHRIYKTHDPRVKIIEPYAEKLLKNKGDNLLWDKYVVVRDEMEDKLGKKGVYVNIFGVIGLVYHALGLPIGSFPIVFALSTQCGWMAHCLEYVSEGKMLEPGAIYIG